MFETSGTYLLGQLYPNSGSPHSASAKIGQGLNRTHYRDDISIIVREMPSSDSNSKWKRGSRNYDTFRRVDDV